jgi:hypothetical protein
MDDPEAFHFFDRFDSFGSAETAIRLRYRYEAIVARNRDLFQGARVLNLNSGDGCWCMAALDAGAEHVVGVEPSRKELRAASTTFAEYGIPSDSYRFISADSDAALSEMKAGAFDLVVCQRRFEESDPRVLFGHLYRLAPQHVILDTSVSRGEGPIIRFRSPESFTPKGTRRERAIFAAPNHALISFLCEYFRFGWRVIDWQEMGIVDWTSVADYGKDRRRTYVLERTVGELT